MLSPISVFAKASPEETETETQEHQEMFQSERSLIQGRKKDVTGPDGQKIKFDGCEDIWDKDFQFRVKMTKEKHAVEDVRYWVAMMKDLGKYQDSPDSDEICSLWSCDPTARGNNQITLWQNKLR